MPTRVTSTHLVGRAAELAELQTALGEAEAQRPALILVGGESGVGKSRLVAEFERLATPDALVLRGEAVEQGDGELPYAPLVGALRPLVRERDCALDRLSPGSRAQLAQLLPGFDDDRTGDDSATRSPDGASSGQLRLFEALLELLDCRSESQPVALILEDVHWADRSTRAFVEFLARSLRDERIMLALTYRTDELHRRHPLRVLLAELDRLERTRRLDLAPFSRGELEEALTDILGYSPSQPLAERLFARSEGNPLYLEELLAAGLDGRGAAPQTLHDAFMLRIERLSDDAQRAARAIAVGRRLDESAIAQLTGMQRDPLQAALREAVAEHVLVAGDGGAVMFRHALLREAVYDDLLPGERSELHLALARAYSEDPAAHQLERAALIAHHYAMAGDQPAALSASVQAALAARAVHAYGEVAALAERALELWPRVPDAADRLPLGHVELLELAACGHRIAGDHARGEVLLRQALTELDEQRDRAHYGELLATLARVLWALNRGAEALEAAQRASALLPEGEATASRAALLSWLARVRLLRGRFRDAVTDAELALATATAAGDRVSEAEGLNTLGMARIALGSVDDGVGCLRRAIALAQAEDDPDGASTAYANLADLLHLTGRTREALQVAREGLAATPKRLTRSYDWMQGTISQLAYETGDWSQAKANLGPPPSQLVGRHLIFRLLREAELALGEGDEELAQERLTESQPLVAASSEPQWIGGLGALLGELRRRQGELVEARAAIASALDRIELCTDDVARIARVSAAGARVEADIAQRARDLRERAQERDAIARARLHVGRLRAAAAEGGPVEQAWLVTGQGELSRARGRPDGKPWAAAAAQWEAVERPVSAAMARWKGAEALIEAGDRPAAAPLVAQAMAVARRVGSRWLVSELSALAQRARLSLGEDGAGAPAADAASANGHEDPFGLTARERQVLALVAQGATNRQIGAALYMAEKTASVHVSRILAKLGVHSRTQAAAVAHRLRLGD